MKNVYIVLSMSGTKFSKFLQFFSKLEYPHVSISLNEDLTQMYSFGRKRIHRPWIAGFVVEQPNKGVFAKYNSKCEVMCLPVSDEVYDALQEQIHKVLEDREKYKYNFLGLFYSYFNIERDLKTRFTCTQFVAWILWNSGVNFNGKDVSLIYPNDYYKLPNIKKKYVGFINQY